ncbi:MAG: tetratricopeptide repeat protein [Flavobacterium sp.]|uniref:tetratricopeptide repeat protein n=1 Tax=Flavobacterium sp. TaxID=239 RepID=UPI0022C50F6E|nr:tetratricopeptide repeat protein [Flavobacterium sp.]MCZ8196155.1 tetratricopeptide repeat protein [Flavobacterium sp.]
MNEELYILFENYINNELSEKEKIDFENQLQNDASIREKLIIYKELNGFLESKFSKESIDFKKNLETISKSNFSEDKKYETKVISFKPYYFAIAASIVLVIGTWFMMQNSMPNYNDYNQHEDAYFTERGDIIKNLKLAQDAFNAKNYSEAITNFEIVLKSHKRPEIEFYYAVSLLEVDKFTESEAIFNNLKSGTSIYKDKSTWYLALSCLKQKKYEETKEFLKQIPEDAEDYAKAEKLLDALN